MATNGNSRKKDREKASKATVKKRGGAGQQLTMYIEVTLPAVSTPSPQTDNYTDKFKYRDKSHAKAGLIAYTQGEQYITWRCDGPFMIQFSDSTWVQHLYYPPTADLGQTGFPVLTDPAPTLGLCFPDGTPAAYSQRNSAASNYYEACFRVNNLGWVGYVIVPLGPGPSLRHLSQQGKHCEGDRHAYSLLTARATVVMQY